MLFIQSVFNITGTINGWSVMMLEVTAAFSWTWYKASCSFVGHFVETIFITLFSFLQGLSSQRVYSQIRSRGAVNGFSESSLCFCISTMSDGAAVLICLWWFCFLLPKPPPKPSPQLIQHTPHPYSEPPTIICCNLQQTHLSSDFTFCQFFIFYLQKILFGSILGSHSVLFLILFFFNMSFI